MGAWASEAPAGRLRVNIITVDALGPGVARISLVLELVMQDK